MNKGEVPEIKNGILKESGAKKSAVKYLTSARLVDKMGNELPYSVAMVAQCVATYRRLMWPLKTIYLCPHHYWKFDQWSRQHMIEKESDSEIKMYTFDGVEINMMERDHVIRNKNGSDEIDWDFYENKTNKNEIN